MGPAAKLSDDLNALKAKWGIYDPSDLKERCDQEGPERHLIQGVIPERALVLIAGESGLGKSPFTYQGALCVAAGVQCLGATVKQTRVLFMDYENGYRVVHDLVTKLSGHLGLSSPPRDLILWNINDCASSWGTPGNTAFDLIRDVKPGLVFIDPVSALNPAIEKSNPEATEVYQQFREIIRDVGCSIVCVHHLKKDSDGVPTIALEDDLRGFFQRVRGASVLVNGSDVRLGIDRPGKSHPNNTEIKLVMRGYSRVRGEIPAWYLSRVLDPDGEAVGYRKVIAVKLLGHPEQEQAFLKLPDRLTTKEARIAYGKGDEATKLFLQKCIAIGILHKVAHGLYEKVKVAE